jgi:protein-tyrosine-phosphatase/predicted ATP-grasp superfamily ATP-dependent carboligase
VVPFARSLDGRRIPVFMASLDVESATVRSRAIRRNFDLSDAANTARVSAISDLIRRERIDCLFPGNDSALSFLAAHYEQLSSLATIATPSPEVLYCVLNKELTFQAAAACDVEVPRTNRYEDLNELVRASRMLSFPLVAKAFSKEVKNTSFKTRYYRDYRSLEREYKADPDFGRKYVLQEFAAGEGFGIEALMDGGEPHLLFAHRRLREYPTTGGVTVVAEAVNPPPALVERALRLLRYIGWDGVAMVEFRWDQAAQLATLMEINGRFWGSLGLSQACGVDFAYGAWCQAHHLPLPPPPTYRPGTRARWTTGVFLRLQEVLHPHSDGMPRPGLAEELLNAGAAFRPGIRDLLWSWRDPRPALDELRRELLKMARGETKRLLLRCLPASALRSWRESRKLETGASRIYLWRQFRDALWRRRSLLPERVQSVLFVCHGNIIRSVFAQKQFEKQMLTWPICARSAGLFAKEGKGADPRAIEAARLHFDLDLSTHSASPLTSRHVVEADAIFVMDRRNEAQLLGRFPGAEQKVFLLAEFSKSQTHPDLELPDPYTGTLDDVVACCHCLADCIGGLIDTLRSRDDRSHGPRPTGTGRTADPRTAHGDGDETSQRVPR